MADHCPGKFVWFFGPHGGAIGGLDNGFRLERGNLGDFFNTEAHQLLLSLSKLHQHKRIGAVRIYKSRSARHRADPYRTFEPSIRRFVQRKACPVTWIAS